MGELDVIVQEHWNPMRVVLGTRGGRQYLILIRA